MSAQRGRGGDSLTLRGQECSSSRPPENQTPKSRIDACASASCSRDAARRQLRPKRCSLRAVPRRKTIARAACSRAEGSRATDLLTSRGETRFRIETRASQFEQRSSTRRPSGFRSVIVGDDGRAASRAQRRGAGLPPRAPGPASPCAASASTQTPKRRDAKASLEGAQADAGRQPRRPGPGQARP